MSKENEIVIPQDIRIYLSEIAERLWSNHAAVMVGAGFSRNAKKNDPTKKDFPDWDQLGNIFYEKLCGRSPNPKEHYLNVLKLADELQAAFGRPVLDQILRQVIPDDDYSPSDLHIKLMNLPWSDIFTTNYDTLLERTAINVTSQRFDIVINKEDLVYSEKPRIIKLHGSFASHRPFIITEEDYRTYPKVFAPFVNTVQQSLLENTLCLVGFSGNDPNFFQWIGWIHDNLGKDNSPKIYLIGLLNNLSDTQKKLLEKRNIVSIDLSVLPNIDDSNEKALNAFLDFLASARKSESNLGWPGTQKLMFPKSNEDIAKQLMEALEEWKAIRENYPNWIILPEDSRTSLWKHTEYWIQHFNNILNLSTPNDLFFLFEMNWRLEKCLSPIFNNCIDVYEKVLARYNPFPESITIEGVINPSSLSDSSLPLEQIKKIWLELHISVMRFYREEGFLDKWVGVNKKIDKVYQFLSPELVAKLYYERCLYYLFCLKIAEVRTQIKEWPINDSLPFWESKRAGIIAELGHIEEAEKILENSLSFIRSQLNLVPISRDYSWVSQEAYVILLLQYIKDSRIFRNNQFEERQKIRQQYNERWNDLKQYKCDPWNELKLFETYLKHAEVVTYGISQKKEFDIGRVTTTHHFSRENKEAYMAYSFLRYCEESGMPFRIPGITYAKEAAEGAIKRIANYSSYWAFATLIRIGDSKIVDAIFNRQSIVKMNIAQIDLLIGHYIEVIENMYSEIETGDNSQQDNFATVLISVIPEILSRLCVKCSDKIRLRLLDFLKIIYSFDQKNKFGSIAGLIERLINSFSQKMQYELIPKLLEFPILYNLHFQVEMEFPEPFYFLSVNKELINNYDKIKIDQNIIQELLQKSLSRNKDERYRSFTRLEKLYRLDLLDREQINNLGVALWSQVNDTSGFPQNIDFYKYAFIQLPHPETIDPELLFKEFVLKEPFPVQGSSAGQGVSMTGGHIPIYHEILGSAEVGIKWSSDEAIQLFNKLFEWWDKDKHYLKNKESDYPLNTIKDEFYKRFEYLVAILSKTLIPQLSINLDNNIKMALSRLLNELDSYGMPSLRARVASLNIFPDEKYDEYVKMLDAISSSSQNVIHDALDSMWGILRSDNETIHLKEDIVNILSLVSQQIKWRRLSALDYSLNMMSHIVDKNPSYLSENLQLDLLIGLHYLNEESDPLNIKSDINIADKLLYRKLAARLSYKLYRYYSNKGEEVPPVIIAWKSICASLNEFADIRNEWLDLK